MSKPQIQNLISELKKYGLDILYANCDGYKMPVKIQNFTPDVIGWDPEKELYHIAVVENSDSLSDQVNAKISTLSNMSMSKGVSEGQRLPFYVGTSKEDILELDKKLQKYGTLQDNIQKVAV